MTQNKIFRFLSRRDLIDVYALEQKAGIPYQTLKKAMKGGRDIPAKHLSNLARVLKPYGLK
jgi:predicted transcriptional regulator